MHASNRTSGAGTAKRSRQAATFVGLALLISGAAGNEAQAFAKSAGQRHTEGVRYVVQRFNPNTPRSDVARAVIEIYRDQCTALGLPPGRCTVFLPRDFPLNVNLILGRINGTPQYKSQLTMLLRTVERAPTLRVLRKDLASARIRGARTLRGAERKNFDDAVSIAVASATLWAPRTEGGLGGGGIRPPKTPVQGKLNWKINWKHVLRDDLIGCLGGLVGGACPEGAIIGSAISVIEQVLE
ncbi:MAG TPA: hypothetical protein VF759_11580 [Allosphingosinicella sp.]|jgi:hypothetical protein